MRSAGRLLAGCALLLAAPAAAAPIRANTPGTGVYQGSGALAGVTVDESSVAGRDLRSVTSFLDLRYTPATHWVLSARVPYVENRLDLPAGGSVSASGPGDLVVSAKHRFYRVVGPWRDRHAAVEVGVKLPTGSTGSRPSPAVPAELHGRIQPGTGSTDLLIDLVYQQARGRWGGAADLAYRRNGEGDAGRRAGDEVRLNGSLQYILLPRVYTRPGKELFVLLEATALRQSADQRHGAALAGTGRTELLLAPGLQYVATEQLFVDLSVQFPCWREAKGDPRSRWNGLLQVRYAF